MADLEVTPATCEAAAAAAAAWLEAQLDENLEKLQFAPHLFKVPYALALAGKNGLGNRVLDFIVTKFSTGEPGCFTAREADSDDLNFANIMLWYRHAVALMGASQLGRWDVASPAAMAALAAQIRECGAGCGGVGQGDFVLSTPSCMVALVLLKHGRLDCATLVAKLMVKLWRASGEGEFLMMYDVAAGEVVRAGAVDAPSRAWLRGRNVLYVVDARRERQHFYASGLAAALLSEVYAATKEAEYLAVACELMAFDRSCTWDGPFQQWPSKCKVAWGAANVLRFGGGALAAADAAAVRDQCERVTRRCFLQKQTAAGDFGVCEGTLRRTLTIPRHYAAICYAMAAASRQTTSRRPTVWATSCPRAPSTGTRRRRRRTAWRPATTISWGPRWSSPPSSSTSCILSRAACPPRCEGHGEGTGPCCTPHGAGRGAQGARRRAGVLPVSPPVRDRAEPRHADMRANSIRSTRESDATPHQHFTSVDADQGTRSRVCAM